MYAELLNRDFVRGQLKDIEQHLGGGSARRGPVPNGMPDLSQSELQSAAAEVRDALQRVDEATQTAQRRGGTTAIDDACFISSDPIISLAQSAIEFHVGQSDAKEKHSRRDGRRGWTDVPPVTDRYLIQDRPSPGRRIFDKFSETDIRWVSSLVAMGIQKFRSPHAFNPVPQQVRIGERCRLIVVGDWGSGLPRAVKVADAMDEYVADSVKQGLDCHVIHLGDVYYSGWEYEYRERFLNHWPVKKSEKDRVGSWSLNGNHDMYSGGFGYFDTLLADPRFARQGKSSFFRLYNDEWQFLGLDTAWDDNGLKDPQASWVREMVSQNLQRTMILTHHQLYSAHENGPSVGKVLREKLGDVLRAGKIEGALWGHEHRCVGHKPFADVQYGRLIGHGGVPVYMTHEVDDVFASPADYEDRRFITSGLEHWAYMGFAVLDFDGPALETRYVDENGRVDRTEAYRREA
jgi:hypothetical protein